MITGVCGHPGTQVPYGYAAQPNWISVDKQIELIKALGAKMYRFDILPSISKDILDEVITKCSLAGIKVLPVISYKTNDEIKAITFTAATENTVLQNLYNETKAYVAQQVALYDAYTFDSVWEMPNELDLLCVQGSQVPGSTAYDYIPNRLKICYWLLKGAIDGTKSVNPNARVIVNCAGWYHYFFFRLLEHPEYFGPDFAAYESVDFDIIGWHWYNTDGLMFAQVATAGVNQDVLSALRSFGKPLWITETNRKYGNQNNEANDQNNVKVIERDLQAVLNQGSDFIEAVFPYLLIDEVTGDANLDYYGLVEYNFADPVYTVGDKKPAFYAVRDMFTRYNNLNKEANPIELSTPFNDSFTRLTVIHGSSTAAGVGPTDPNRAWAVQLTNSEVALGRTVTNRAFSGDDTRFTQPNAQEYSQIVDTRNITSTFTTYRPDIIVYAYNNDVVAGVVQAETLANIARVKNYCERNNVKFFAMSGQPRNVVDSQRQALKNLSDAIIAVYGDDAIDTFTPFARTDGTLATTLYQIKPEYDADGTHLNDAAHDIIFALIKAKVEAYYGTLPAYNRFPDFRVRQYWAEVESATGMVYPVSMTLMQQIENLIGYLVGENLWSSLVDGYVLGNGQNVSVGDVLIPIKGLYPLFDEGGATGGPITVSSNYGTFAESGMRVKSGKVLIPATSATVVGFTQASAQAEDFASIISQHQAGQSRRFLIGTGSSTNSNDLAVFWEGVGTLTSDNNFFDNQIRMFQFTYNAVRAGMRINFNSSEIYGADTALNIGQYRTALGANGLGAGPNNFAGRIYALLVFSSYTTAMTIATKVDEILNIGAES